jgi:hypothetical protein
LTGGTLVAFGKAEEFLFSSPPFQVPLNFIFTLFLCKNIFTCNEEAQKRFKRNPNRIYDENSKKAYQQKIAS